VEKRIFARRDLRGRGGREGALRSPPSQDQTSGWGSEARRRLSLARSRAAVWLSHRRKPQSVRVSSTANARFSFCCVYQGGRARDTTHARPAIVTHSKRQPRPCRAYGGRDVPAFKTHGGRLPKERRHGANSTPPPRRFAL